MFVTASALSLWDGISFLFFLTVYVECVIAFAAKVSLH